MIEDEPWSGLKRWTTARIALGRTGDALPTRRVLEFQLAHAQARDAVHLPLDVEQLARGLTPLNAVPVCSLARSRADYLRRPDLGRRLDPDSAGSLALGLYDAAIVLADGLSARAVHENGSALARKLQDMRPDWAWAPVVIATQARVALGDPIAERLGAALVVVLIGERPGLTSADSLGAYITWRPRPGVTRDAERNCVSNIRAGGLPAADAAARIIALMTAAQRLGMTGVGLKEDDALALSTSQSQPAALERSGGEA
jgi:ethanolamine ammonia-lyase small subunit